MESTTEVKQKCKEIKRNQNNDSQIHPSVYNGRAEHTTEDCCKKGKREVQHRIQSQQLYKKNG